VRVENATRQSSVVSPSMKSRHSYRLPGASFNAPKLTARGTSSARASIEVHPHSLRAAFAVEFLETHPGELEALRRLLGHSKPETTQISLRRLDRERSMESVQDLSWGARFAAFAEEAPSGFEPL
jgi:integrase